ncbi:MAG: hypothetical protein J6W23_08965, partial [Victivallales bacterium]|nr:hypothetical protein [Victivallales bacterium]
MSNHDVHWQASVCAVADERHRSRSTNGSKERYTTVDGSVCSVCNFPWKINGLVFGQVERHLKKQMKRFFKLSENVITELIRIWIVFLDTSILRVFDKCSSTFHKQIR